MSRILALGLAVVLALGTEAAPVQGSPSPGLLVTPAAAGPLAVEYSLQGRDDRDDDSRRGSDDFSSGVKLRGDGSVDDDQPSVQGSDDFSSGVKVRGDGSVDDSQPSLQGSDDASRVAVSSFAFKLGFKLLADQIPGLVGAPLENERYGANGDSLQQTTRGLMVWRKSDNWTAFTDGATTWVNGPFGVQSRPNNLRFPWEAP